MIKTIKLISLGKNIRYKEIVEEEKEPNVKKRNKITGHTIPFEVNGTTYKAGDLVKAKVQNRELAEDCLIVGYRSFSYNIKPAENDFCLLQNTKTGSWSNLITRKEIRDTIGLDFDCGWHFYSNQPGSDVTIIKKVGEIDLSKFDSDKIMNPTGDINYEKLGSTVRILYKGEVVISFLTQGYPSCCGSTIFHAFTVSSDFFPEEIIEKLKKSLINYTTNITAIVKDSQPTHIALLEQLGFEKDYEFVNKNTNNLLHFYHFNNKY